LLKELKGALGIGGVEIAGWFVGQDDFWIVSQRARDGYALLFTAGKMTARSAQFVAQAHRFQKIRSALAHFRIGKLPKLAHRDHHVLLRGEVFHQKMELKNEADELASLMR